MPYKVKVKPHVRRRPVTPRMREVFEKLGMKPEVAVDAHERGYTARRAKPKRDEDEREDG